MNSERIEKLKERGRRAETVRDFREIDRQLNEMLPKDTLRKLKSRRNSHWANWDGTDTYHRKIRSPRNADGDSGS